MGRSDKSGGSTGIGFVGLLQLVFIILKFLNVITWPWYIVLLPLEIEGAILILVLIFLACRLLRSRTRLNKLKKSIKNKNKEK